MTFFLLSVAHRLPHHLPLHHPLPRYVCFLMLYIICITSKLSISDHHTYLSSFFVHNSHYLSPPEALRSFLASPERPPRIPRLVKVKRVPRVPRLRILLLDYQLPSPARNLPIVLKSSSMAARVWLRRCNQESKCAWCICVCVWRGRS